jgi:hypothetical protein
MDEIQSRNPPMVSTVSPSLGPPENQVDHNLAASPQPNDTHNFGMSTISQSPAASIDTRLKRPRLEVEEPGEARVTGNGKLAQDIPTAKKKRKRKGPTTATIQIACPFGLLEPRKYPECLVTYTNANIHELRQHFKRVHSQPEHCVRCGAEPGSPILLRAHQLEDCDIQPFTKEGISLEQWEKLDDASKKNQDPCRKWKEMCGILFPGIQPPDSPFIGPGHEELARAYHRVWCKERLRLEVYDIVKKGSNLVPESHQLALTQEICDKLIGSFDDWLEFSTKDGAQSNHGMQAANSPTEMTRPSFSYANTELEGGLGAPPTDWQPQEHVGDVSDIMPTYNNLLDGESMYNFMDVGGPAADPAGD